MAARFRSAEEGTEVGGDFYDVFPVGGAWNAVMGDVTGKGPAAAAVTGLARYTLRTAAMYEERRARCSSRLNETLLGEQRQCSAVCARLERERRRVDGDRRLRGPPARRSCCARASRRRPSGAPGTLGGAFADGPCDRRRP